MPNIYVRSRVFQNLLTHGQTDTHVMCRLLYLDH